ncbi:MAG: preprotein translocase subunit SecG [Pseudomonadales bacterium]|nr:preprotein translocase subunit SecG [Pseudomonadales bacterium]
MEILETLVLIVHVVAAISIIGLVLLQQGRGAEMGAGFGSGASGTVFGSGGAGNFLTRMTTTIAIAFFLTSFGLAFFAKEKSEEATTLGIPEVIQPATPAEDSSESEVPAPASESEIPEVEEAGAEVPAIDEAAGDEQ